MALAVLGVVSEPARSPATAAPALAPPPNDNWDGRLHWQPNWESGADTFPVAIDTTNVEATLQPGESAQCAPIGATIWYEWWPERSGTLTVDTAGSTINTVLAIYTQGSQAELIPSPPGGNLAAVACDDNALGLQSRVSVGVSPGKPIWIQVGGVNGEQGAIRVNATCVCPPPNDRYDSPGDLYVDEITSERRVSTSTAYATTQPDEPRPCGNIGATLWYTFYAPSNVNLVLDTTGSDFDTAVAVYQFNGYPPFPGATVFACNDNAGSPQARLAFTAQGNSQYYVQAGGANGATGNLRLRLACDPACPPYTDNFGQATFFPPGALEVQTAGATLEPNEPRPCGDIGKTVWHGVIVQGSARVRVDAAGSSFPVVLAAYETVSASPPPESLDLIECRAATGGAQPSISFDVAGRTTVWVQAGGVGGAGGTLSLNFDCDPSPCPPYNDSIAEPVYLGIPYSFPYEESFDVRGATTEAGEDLSCGSMGATTWFRIDVLSGPIQMLFETDGSLHDTAMAVYEAPGYYPVFDSPSALTRIACSPGGDGERASAEVTLNAGITYYVQVGGRGGATSENLRVAAECVPACPPEHDNIAQAFYLNSALEHTFDTTGATLEAGEPRPCENIGRTAWYLIPAHDAPRSFTFDATGAGFAPVLATYGSAGVSPPGGANPIACASSALTLEAQPGLSYMLQVGGANETGGEVSLSVSCTGCPVIPPPDTGGPVPLPGGDGSPGGTIVPPDTGNGGYLPSRRQE